MAEEAKAKALAIAAKLNSRLGAGAAAAAVGANVNGNQAAVESILGKRTATSFSSAERKKKKIYVPVDKFPDVNFFGLLIGPRGATQKMLEAETGARILIRGKGTGEDTDEDMYVLIMADTEDQLERASTKINDLIWNDEHRSQTKNTQLSTLHASNGSFSLSVGGPGGLPSSLYANDQGFKFAQSTNRYKSAREREVEDEEKEREKEEREAARKAAKEGEEKKDILVPADRVGNIIGRGGEVIKSLQNSTGALIQISKQEIQGNERIVTLIGSHEQINAAEDEIKRILNSERNSDRPRHDRDRDRNAPRGGIGFNNGSNGPSESMLVPHDLVGWLIGKSGETIRQLQMRTNTTINILKDAPPREGVPEHEREVIISGHPSAIAHAREEIEIILRDGRESTKNGPGYSSGGHGGGSSSGSSGGPGVGSSNEKMYVPNALVGTIIGRGGEVIKRLQALTGARIQISKEDDEADREIVLVGRPDQTAYAKEEIERLLREKETSGGPPGGGRGGRHSFGPPGHYGRPHGPPHGFGQGGYPPYGPPGYGGAGGYGPPGYGPPGYGPPGYGPPGAGAAPYPPPGFGTDLPPGAPGADMPPGAEPFDPHAASNPAFAAAPGTAPTAEEVPTTDPAAASSSSAAATADSSSSSSSSSTDVSFPPPPTDPNEYAAWWGALSYEQQVAYYKSYYGEEKAAEFISASSGAAAQ